MNKSDLTKLLPRHANDVANAREIIALGYTTVEPVLKSLFQWLGSNGSPVELTLRPFFAELGEPSFDLVRDALRAKPNPALKHTLLRYVLPHWPAQTVARLVPEIGAFLDTPDFHGLDVWALRLMIDKGIESHSGNERWRNSKIERMRELLAVLEQPNPDAR